MGSARHPLVNEAGEVIDHAVAAIPMAEVKILHDWDTIGIHGSGSSSVSVENVFVPDARIISLSGLCLGVNDGGFKQEDLYCSAMIPVMAIILVFPTVGLGMHMLEAILETLPGKNIAYTAYTNQMEAPVTHLQIGEASAKIDCAKLVVAKACVDIDAWAARHEMMPYMERARILLGRLSGGFLLDRVSAPLIGFVSCILPVVSGPLLLFNHSVAAAVFAASMIGLSAGSEIGVLAYLVPRYFGTRHFGLLFGVMNALITVGLGGGPLLAAKLYDHFGNYNNFLVLTVPLFALSAVLLGTLGQPQPALQAGSSAQPSNALVS